MKSKIITAIGAGSLVVGMLALSGCFESSYPDYGGYGYERGYYAEPAPVVVRDYDNHHWWQRDRDDHDRDSDHRKESVSNDHNRDRDTHARTDSDHDHDAH